MSHSQDVEETIRRGRDALIRAERQRKRIDYVLACSKATMRRVRPVLRRAGLLRPRGGRDVV